MTEKPRPTIRVLMVDDQAVFVEKVRRILKPHDDIMFCSVTDPVHAVGAAVAFGPTVILQDIVMPEIGGLELIKRYREAMELSTVPIVVLSGNESPHLKEQSFLTGANDYLVKLPDTIELLARIRYHSRAFLHGVERERAFHLLQVSQSQLSSANIQLQKLSGLDGLTGIPNRRQLDEVLIREWKRGLRKGTPLSFLMCDIDYFKRFNDVFGHVEGDFCLKRVAAVLTEQLKRSTDLTARYGGEEFGIVLPDTDIDGARIVAEACLKSVRNLGILAEDNGSSRVVTLSIGAASVLPAVGISVSALIQHADKALYAAKQSGRDRLCIAGDTALAG